MFGVRGRLILTSAALVAVLVGALAWGGTVQSRRLIEEGALRLERRTHDSLRRAASAMLESLAETSRLALLQSDYATIQETFKNLARTDKLVLQLTLVGKKKGVVLADTRAADVGKTYDAPAWTKAHAKALTLSRELETKGIPLATVRLAYSKAPLLADLARSEEMKRGEVRRALSTTLLIGVVALLIGIALTILQGVRITRPIADIARKADQIANGDLLARVEVRGRDELGLLADRFNYMAEQVAVLLEHAQQKAVLEQELELASAVQATLVPSSSVVQREGVSIAGYFQPASRCAGDWWNYYELSRGRTMMIVGDVTGHGVAAAMITAAAKGAVTTTIARSGGEATLQDVLGAMNAAIYEASPGQFAMTCFASIFDPQASELHYANAGHIFPVYAPADKAKVTALVARGNRLGDVLDSHYTVVSRKVAPGDVVVWFTDGIVECIDAKGREFGARRLRALVGEQKGNAPETIRDVLVERTERFAGGPIKHDDVTLIVGKFS